MIANSSIRFNQGVFIRNNFNLERKPKPIQVTLAIKIAVKRGTPEQSSSIVTQAIKIAVSLNV